MKAKVREPFSPRKTPVQARAALTVEAIFEATIQVLLSHGADRLTTTKVAERAGVSVGTLYQYYPNKQSLLFALLEQKLELVAVAVETVCEDAQGKPLAEMVQLFVQHYVDAKMLRPDISAALYRISTEIEGPALVKRMAERSIKALQKLIVTASGAGCAPDLFAVEFLYAAMAGATRMVLESGASPAAVRKLREHLVVLCLGYFDGLRDARA